MKSHRWTSRKFLITLATQVTAIAVLAWPGHESVIVEASESITALVVLALSTLGYVHAEASVDRVLPDRIGNADLATQDAVHPIVITHPDTGRKALYVNSAFTIGIDGWSQGEAKPLLERLYRHFAVLVDDAPHDDHPFDSSPLGRSRVFRLRIGDQPGPHENTFGVGALELDHRLLDMSFRRIVTLLTATVT